MIHHNISHINNVKAYYHQEFTMLVACDLHARIISREVSQITHHIDEAHQCGGNGIIFAHLEHNMQNLDDFDIFFFGCTLYHSWRCRDALPAGLLEVVRVWGWPG